MDFNQYYVTQRFKDDYGTPILLDRNENKNVFDNKIVLDTVPDEINKVVITSIDGVATNEMVEIPYYNTIQNANQFKVDYRVSGFVYFHPSREGQTMGLTYKGKGYVCLTPNRIATVVGTDGAILETLDKLINDTQQAKTDTITATNDANTAIDTINTTNTAMHIYETYDPSKPYLPLNKVTWQGSSYVCIANSQGISPSTDATKWLMIASKGNDGLSSMFFSTFTATANNTLHITHNLNYNPSHDFLQVIDVAYNSIMTKNVNYTENADNLSIDLNSTTGILNGEQIQFILFKNIK